MDPSRNLAPSNHLPSGLRTDWGDAFWIDLNLVQRKYCIDRAQIMRKGRDYRLLMLAGFNLLVEESVKLVFQTRQFASKVRSLLCEP
jgi:hypothetical protein